ncbi:MAG: hypothetical protein RIC19_22165 [Phaeodactylibacter sp.]|uniref:hypothetical protein n=1 Tax=Phaeodactylibacter sp. TaxID=1940289 RepID=UPI0032EDAAB9
MEFKQLSPLELRDLINKYNSDLRKLQYQVLKTQAMIDELEGYAAQAEEVLGLDLSITKEAPEAAPPAPAKKAPAKKAAAKKAPTKKAPEEKAVAEKAPEKKATTETAPEKPKRRGRPPGSKNKKTAAKKTKSAGTQTKSKGRGRPPGSKNKNKPTASKEKTNKATATKKTSPPAKEDDAPGYRLSNWDDFVLNSIKEKQKVLTTSDLTKIGVANPDIKLGAAQIKTKLNASLHKLANKKELLAKVEHSGRGFAYALQEWVSKSGELPKKYVED